MFRPPVAGSHRHPLAQTDVQNPSWDDALWPNDGGKDRRAASLPEQRGYAFGEAIHQGGRDVGRHRAQRRETEGTVVGGFLAGMHGQDDLYASASTKGHTHDIRPQSISRRTHGLEDV